MGIYADKYKALHERFNTYKNFDAIAEAIEHYFSDIFQLEVLNQLAGECAPTEIGGSYLQLFAACMQHLQQGDAAVDPTQDLSTASLVVKKLDTVLRTEKSVIDLFLHHYVLKPPSKTSPQVGFIEKLATGGLKVGEPLTYVDMRRTIAGLRHLKKFGFPAMEVMHLRNLPLLDAATIYQQNTALFINVSLNPKQPPKWCVLDLQDKYNPRLYCEMPLIEAEKAALEKVFKLGADSIHYIEPTSDSIESTGYAAIAWLSSDEVPAAKAWNFDVDSDFSMQLRQLYYVLWGGDSSSFTYTNTPGEQNYFTEAYRRISTGIYEGSPSKSNEFKGGHTARNLASVATMGSLYQHSFRPGDLAAVVQLTLDEDISKQELDPILRFHAYRTGLPGFNETLKRKFVQEDGDKNTLVISNSLMLYDDVDLAHGSAVGAAGTGTNTALYGSTYDSLDNYLLHIIPLPTDLAPYRNSLIWTQTELYYVTETGGLEKAHLTALQQQQVQAFINVQSSLQKSSGKKPELLELPADIIKQMFFYTDQGLWIDLHLTGIVKLHLIAIPDVTTGLTNYQNQLIWDESTQQLAYVNLLGNLTLLNITNTNTFAANLEIKFVKKITLSERQVTHMLPLSHGLTVKKKYADRNAYAAALLVMGLVRFQAKKRILSIALPAQYVLDEEDQQFIINMLSENAYVTELILNEVGDLAYSNLSLEQVKHELTPIFARNRWLKENGYLPPMVDDYWEQAAFYWLTHLYKEENVLAIKDSSAHNDIFKRCVQKMGLRGLVAVLDYLNDPARAETISNMYGLQKPAFYLACQPYEFAPCLKRLLQHLRQSTAYFPYQELGIAYQLGNDHDFIELLGHINRIDYFERITLTECVKPATKRHAFEAFLQALIQEATAKQWVGAIFIPELDDAENLASELRPLRNLYTHLNNIITRNRHALSAHKTIKGWIEKKFDFKLPAEEVTEPVASINRVPSDDSADAGVAVKQDSWPFNRGGTVQLQVAQQINIAQEFQVQQEQQRVVVNTYEEAIIGKLLDYDNIATELQSYYNDFKAEHADPIDSATLKTLGEHPLQSFFHTWISAEPNVRASQVIQKMTPDAAKELLHHHRRLKAGLNPDNLPKGFYTQRSKSGELILCYNATLGYARTPNEFTLDLELKTPKAEAWEGDCRIFNPEYYATNPMQLALTPLDWQYMQLFALMQPEDAQDDAQQAALFLKQYATALGLSAQDITQIQTHWKVFWQVWSFAGEDGFQQFKTYDFTHQALSLEKARELIAESLPLELQVWFQQIPMDARYLRALGQIYFRHGPKVMEYFLRKLYQMETAFADLDDQFFNEFNQHVLGCSTNFNQYITDDGCLYKTIDAMMATLTKPEHQGSLRVWKTVSRQHMQAVGWDSVDHLWKAYSVFLQTLNDMGLRLEGEEFEGIAPTNMFILMDRILGCLQQIPDTDLKKIFLREFKHLDLTHGGVYYAIKHEGFKYFDASLFLARFGFGTPTYRPQLSTIYSDPRWQSPQYAKLSIWRVLASETRFDPETYEVLKAQLATADKNSKDLLLLLVHTQYPNGQITHTLPQFEALAQFKPLLAKALHVAIYDHGQVRIVVTLPALQLIPQLALTHSINKIQEVLQRYPQGTLLEALSMLDLSKRTAQADALVALFEKTIGKPSPTFPDALFFDGYKLATLFGIFDEVRLTEFYALTAKMPSAARQELERLIAQLLSVNYETTDKMLLQSPQNEELWQKLQTCIQDMSAQYDNPAPLRLALLDEFYIQGMRFKYSRGGYFRAIEAKDPLPKDLDTFRDHQQRLWQFFKDHVAVPADKDVEESLKDIFRFLQSLQNAPRRYLNEIEPLLATLEKTPKDHYWSANYLYGLLMALQVKGEEDDSGLKGQSFPISLLSSIIQHPTLAAKSIDEIDDEFPLELREILQFILKSTFERPEKATLCKIALMEYKQNSNNLILKDVMGVLQNAAYADSQQYALSILMQATDCIELERRFDKCRQLLQHPGQNQADIQPHWSQTSQYWLRALSQQPSAAVEALYQTINEKFNGDPEQQALILHIIAWSTLAPNLQNAASDKFKLNAKAIKLVERLHDKITSDADLILLAKCYPKQPAPEADDVLRLIKAHTAIDATLTWAEQLEQFARQPYPLPRADYAEVVASREVDLQRMIADTKVSGEDARAAISADDTIRLTTIFSYLKGLEQGQLLLPGLAVPIARMSPAELAEAFRSLSLESSYSKNATNDLLRAQLWAVLFEVLGRTTRKYPHLAQQFALIANDICVTGCDSRVLQLATGEGKSHFVALRAAKHAGQGKVVDICTAKRVLAERDLQDYNALFNYLGLTAAYIDPKTPIETYRNAQIHYSTTGDLSLFIDEQSFNGEQIGTVEGLHGSIEVTRENRVALFDEFDFICFDEGRKTEYNYARPTGKTPKEMIWLYQAINAFYTDECKGLDEITADLLTVFKDYLLEQAGESVDKQLIIKPIISDDLQMVQWLQSAYQAHSLEWQKDFTVREENIKVGDESYPMREIIPLSQDNQKMIGSTFSGGVHQLLAVRLNTMAKLGQLKDEGFIDDFAQNFHIHPESNIISSQVAAQRMQELWSEWEGFTGTISSAQAKTLHTQQGTQVLHVPTNQRDLRKWHEPKFYNDGEEEQRYDDIVAQIRICLENKQSILFACKNDKQVNSVRKILETKLSATELAHLIFYTNEDPRPADQVLQDKQSKEKWRGGQKQQGIGLIASGFGRGDNVGVEAVFLMDVSDTNDKLQKGGRTARNGAEGEVFQFYLNKDIAAERQRCEHNLTALLSSKGETIPDIEVPDHMSLSQKRFEELMLLREFEFGLQNVANEGYHGVLAQFSSWTMQLFALNKLEQGQQEALARALSVRMQLIEKDWLNISPLNNTATEKVKQISQSVKHAAKSLALYAGSKLKLAEIPAFDLRAYVEPVINIGTIQQRQASTLEAQALANICTVYARLANQNVTDSRLPRIALGLKELAKHSTVLRSFANKATFYKTLDEFARALTVDLSKTKGTAAQQLAAASQIELTDYRELLSLLSDVTRDRLTDVMQGLHVNLIAAVMEELPTADIWTPEQRVLRALPILEYLQTFSGDQQAEWGPAYFEELKTTFNTPELKPEILHQRLQATTPMSLSQLKTLWTLTQRYTQQESEFNDLMAIIEFSLRGGTEQRLRAITQQAAWSRDLSSQNAKDMMLAFCQSMAQFKEGENWDVFENCVKQTQSWWNRGGEHAYVPELAILWLRLSAQANHIPELAEFIQWSLKLRGKSWFQILSLALTLPSELLVQQQTQIKALWLALDQQPGLKKRDKTAKFESCLKGLEKFCTLMNDFDANLRAELAAKAMALPANQLQSLMAFIQQQQEAFIQQPRALIILLKLYATTKPAATTDTAQPLTAEEQERFNLTQQAILLAIKQANQSHQLMDVYFPGLQQLNAVLAGLASAKHQQLLAYIQHNPAILNDAGAVTLCYDNILSGELSTTALPAWLDVLTQALQLKHQDPTAYTAGRDALLQVFHQYRTRYFATLSAEAVSFMQQQIADNLESILLNPVQFAPILKLMPHLFAKGHPYARELSDLLITQQVKAQPQSITALVNFIDDKQVALASISAPAYEYFQTVTSEHHALMLADEQTLATLLTCCQQEPMVKSRLALITAVLLQVANAKQDDARINITPICDFLAINSEGIFKLSANQFEHLLTQLAVNIERLVDYSDIYLPVFQQILVMMSEPALQPLHAVLLEAAIRKVEHPAKVNLPAVFALFDKACQGRLVNLPPERLTVLLDTIQQQQHNIIDYPDSYGQVTQYLLSVNGLKLLANSHYTPLLEFLWTGAAEKIKSNAIDCDVIGHLLTTIKSYLDKLPVEHAEQVVQRFLSYQAAYIYHPAMYEPAFLAVLNLHRNYPLATDLAQIYLLAADRQTNDPAHMPDYLQQIQLLLTPNFLQKISLLPLERREAFIALIRQHQANLLDQPVAYHCAFNLLQIFQLHQEDKFTALILAATERKVVTKAHTDDFLTFIAIHQKELSDLPAKPKEIIVQLMQAHLPDFIDYPKSYMPALTLILEIEQSHPQWSALNAVALTAARLNHAFGIKVERVYEFIREISGQLSELPNGTDFVTLILQHQETMITHSAQYLPIMHAIMGYQWRPWASMEPERFALIRQLLLNVAAYQVRNPQVSLDALIEAVDRFQDNTAVLQRLNELVVNDEHYGTMELLFQDLTAYLDSTLLDQVSKKEQKAKVAGTFFTLSKATEKARQQPSWNFENDSKIKALFNFNNPEVRNERMMFMRTLYKQVADKPVNQSQGEIKGLEYGFSRYVMHATRLLDKPSKTHVKKQRDLTVEQQIGLLSLTDELAYISNTTNAAFQKTKNGGLKKSMNAVIEKYEAAWFKSNERRQQLKDLQQMLEAHPQDYATLLTRLNELKMAALLKDTEVNAERWLKMNWSGQSRYLNTLNQLHDVVVRAWVSDPSAVASFQTYQAHYHDALDGLIDHLKTNIDAALTELKQQPQWSKNKGAFFAYEHHAIYKVYAALQVFNAHEKDGHSTAVLMRDLRSQRDSNQLPRYLINMVDQVLLQGEAYAVSLYNQEKRGHKPG